jgi:PilZ domain-containing protein
MTQTTILIGRDAGAAGRALLVRRDLELRWSLTVAESIAALKREPRPTLLVLREHFAAEVLSMAKSVARNEEGDLPPIVVLLEPDGWTRRDSYFGAGATALAQHNSEERVLEAIGSLTGLQFRHHPRVPYSTVIDVNLGGDRLFLETIDLSLTGMSIRGIPSTARMGDRAELHFMMLEPSFTVTGVVARVFEEHGETVAAFSFENPGDDVKKAVAAIVAHERENAPSLPEPMDMRLETAGALTQDLVAQLRSDSDAADVYRNMLKERLANPPGVSRVPSWLERVGRALTKVERRALLKTKQPEFAIATIDLRIRLCRMRLEGDWPVDVECARALEVCKTLATDARSQGEDVLADVTLIRAALLRSVYGDPKNESLEIVDVQET